MRDFLLSSKEIPLVETAPTRPSLLIRLRDKEDSEAWGQFVEIYSPLIFSFARRCGLQDSDAADLVQEVMGEIHKSIDRFEYDPQLGKFRSWLYKIAKRTKSRIQKKQAKQPLGTGDSAAMAVLANQSDSHDEIQAFWDREYQRNLLQWAAEQVRPSINETTWQAFWMTAVEEKESQTVAEQLGLSLGSVYVAKSRVTKRLAEEIQKIDDQQQLS